MKKTTLAVLSLLISASQAGAAPSDVYLHKGDKTNGSERSGTKTVFASVWGMQAVSSTTNRDMQSCQTLISRPIKTSVNKSVLDDDYDETGIDLYPTVLRASICTYAEMLAANAISAKHKGSSEVPHPLDTKEAKVVAKLNFDELFANAARNVWFEEKDLQLFRKPTGLSWRIKNNPYGFDTSKGRVYMTRNGVAWYDETTLIGDQKQFIQSISSSTSNSDSKSFKVDEGGQ